MNEDDAEEISLTTSRERDGEESSSGGEMSFLEHLEELRSVLIFCVVAFVVSGAVALVFSGEIFAALRWPLEHAPSVPADEAQALVVMRFMDVFSILLYIALLGGIVFSGPFVLYRIAGFIAPALSSAERSRMLPLCAAASVFFLAGAAAAFFWLAPISVGLPYMLSEHFGMQMTWLAEDYYQFVVMLTLFSGLMFEFPLVVVFLQCMGLVSKKTLLEKWRWVLSGILIAGVLISPIGDPVALLAFSGILFVFYLAAIFVGDYLRRRGENRVPARFDDVCEKSR